MEDDSYTARMRVLNPNVLQLYSAATPNGIKVAAMLEELVDLRKTTDNFNYEPHTVDLRQSESRRVDFLLLNPNGKIPVIVDPHGPGDMEIKIFDSGAILIYLAEKYQELLPPLNTMERYETMKWLMWGSTGISVQFKLFGFFFKYCTQNLPFCVSRYEKECKRLLCVLENQLKNHNSPWIIGDTYTIADICIWPWIYALQNNYDNAFRDVFDDFKDYPYIVEWYTRCVNRPASIRSLDVTLLN